LVDPLQAGPGVLRDGEDAGQLTGRMDELPDVAGEGEERAQADPVVQGQPARQRQRQDRHLRQGRMVSSTGW